MFLPSMFLPCFFGPTVWKYSHLLPRKVSHMSRTSFSLLALLILFVACPPALACSLCANLRVSATLRDDAARSQVIVYGPVSNARLNGNGGVTDLQIESVIKSHAIIAGRKSIELPQYVPVGD